MKSPDKTLFFFFRSVPKELNEDIWIVRMTLPPNSTEESLMTVEATDGNEKPLDSAVFVVSGCRVAVSGGKGHLSYGEFVEGMSDKSVWMIRPGHESVPGLLTFG